MSRAEQDDNFDESTYVKVNVRLSEFRGEFTEGFETTFREETERGVSFKCVLFRNKNEAILFGTTRVAAASGHSFLPDCMEGEKMEEYAETVALGRALAKLGFKIEKGIASSEEMDQFERTQEAKSEQASKDDCEDEDMLEKGAEVKLKSSRKFKENKKKSRFNRG